MFHGHLDYFQKPPLGGRPNTKPEDHFTPNTHNNWFVLFYCVWEPAWIEIHWNNTWLRGRSHVIAHYTWESVITLHDLGSVLGRPLDTLFWAPTISWSRLLAHVWSGPKGKTQGLRAMGIWLKFSCSQFPTNDRGELAVGYRWTGWVWEITGWNSRLRENYWSFRGI